MAFNDPEMQLRIPHPEPANIKQQGDNWRNTERWGNNLLLPKSSYANLVHSAAGPVVYTHTISRWGGANKLQCIYHKRLSQTVLEIHASATIYAPIALTAAILGIWLTNSANQTFYVPTREFFFNLANVHTDIQGKNLVETLHPDTWAITVNLQAKTIGDTFESDGNDTGYVTCQEVFLDK